jgi:bifunctional UDP-N-acetylglucosamine pyrophosphorylase/glucosamine-1-phosphate N-acetyltransferase
VDFAAVIENGVTVYHNNFITGNSVIKKGCILMPNNTINNSVLCENVIASASTFNEAFVGEGTTVGPNAYLRPRTKIGAKCKIGDFVEIKNAQIGNGTKVSHLAYVGDAEIGENCNIGCGVIFVNYNGKTKSRTVVGNNSFIGSNCNIIAPVNIGNKVFVAAGTTVTKDLKDDDFCIGRVRPEIKENMAKKYID